MKTVKTIWAPPPNQLHRPRAVNRKMVWTLWTSTIVLLAAWLGALVAGVTLGGWIHVLLVATAAMAAFTFFYGLRHDEYFERPPHPKKRKWQFRRRRKNHPAPPSTDLTP